MMKAFMITLNKYPLGDAGAVRDDVFAQMLMESGYNVDIVCLGPSTNFGFISDKEKIRYLSCRSSKRSMISKLRSILQFGFQTRKMMQSENYDLILYDTLFPFTTLSIILEARKQRIPIVHNSVEWYSPSEFSLSVLSPRFLMNRFTTFIAGQYATGVISISKFLHHYFMQRGGRGIRIPFIIDFEKYQQINRGSRTFDSISFTYAGSPGRKDDIKPFLKAIALLEDEERERVFVHIVGVTQERLKKDQSVDAEIFEQVQSVVRFYGCVPKAQADDFVRSAHYTFLFRDASKTFAKAGFPTKVVESCAMGVPVLCNLSSDLGEFLVDDVNAVIANTNDARDIVHALRRCLAIDRNKWHSLSYSAMNLAKTRFTYQGYAQNMHAFLKEVSRAVDEE